MNANAIIKNTLEKWLTPIFGDEAMQERGSQLECDGFSTCISFALAWNGVPHQVFYGEIDRTVDGVRKDMSVHVWVKVGDIFIDYALRMWLGEGCPHGMFTAKEALDAGVSYRSEQVTTMTKFPFDMITARILWDQLTGFAGFPQFPKDEVNAVIYASAMTELGDEILQEMIKGGISPNGKNKGS